MRVSEHLVSILIRYGVRDAFGIPGGVLMQFLHDLEASKKIALHLNYHEQAAAYAACGYAQQSGKLCLAYATKGPGICNMVTTIAEAYVDSIPVVFMTAHSGTINKKMRMLDEQEIDIQQITRNITKKTIRINNIEDANAKIEEACRLALTGRKGPVFIDINTKVLMADISDHITITGNSFKKDEYELKKDVLERIRADLKKATRPLILIGDGIRQAGVIEELKEFVKFNNIPVLSSRCSQDILKESKLYYGYIGSHATRYSNFILAKADLIISLGNRMAFPVESETYRKALKNKKIIRVDIDGTEFNREIPNSVTVCADLESVLHILKGEVFYYHKSDEWVRICDMIKELLWEADVNDIVDRMSNIIDQLPHGCTIVGDIGNNELWLSRAVAYSKNMNVFLCHSKAMKTVGCAIPKAIGCYYAKREPIVCITGDQGAQFNIQELQYIALEHLPIKIIILNNLSSGMLRDYERKKGYVKHIQTTLDSGYSSPNFENIARAYGIKYILLGGRKKEIRDAFENKDPLIVEMDIDDEGIENPFIPRGNDCYNFEPQIEKGLYERLKKL